ncbi:MAG: nucleoside phosphorylase [Actinomycetota bacterium]
MPQKRVERDVVLPVIGTRASDLPSRMLVVGDPSRARRIAEQFDDANEVGQNREYLTITGSYRGHQVGVISHGVGAAGAAVCFEELCRGGVEHLIRAGTAGGMQPHVVDGALVISTAAVRNEGVTAGLVPLGFPAGASVNKVLALRKAAAASPRAVEEGVVLSNAAFYSHGVLGSDLELWQRAGVVAVEMEAAALFITAALHGVEAGAILAVDGNPLAEHDDDMSGYDPDRKVVHEAVDEMITVSLEALTMSDDPA